MRRCLDSDRVPMMGVMGAFVFAAQMVNFSIPGTGSSGHLGGGLLLAIMLGPSAGFVTIASILTVQALLFADGGLLALGCNIVNLGLFPCFLAYPLIYLPLAGKSPTTGRIATAGTIAAIVGLAAGATGVVVETASSGVSDLPIGKFMLLMLPIHLAIGLVEGLVTTAVVTFIWKARPEALDMSRPASPGPGRLAPVAACLLLAACVTGGLASWLASGDPDGLEWAVARAADKPALAAPVGGVHAALQGVQERTALLPDYDFPPKENEAAAETAAEAQGQDSPEDSAALCSPSAATSVSGLVGGAASLVMALAAGWLFRGRRRSRAEGAEKK
jgi:cobalt/nickel transport system permease protein